MELKRKTKRMSDFLAGARTAEQGGEARRFWNIASTDEDSGEIILYGDVMSQKPRSFWTGEERPGLYITPEGFLEDLAVVKGKRISQLKSTAAEAICIPELPSTMQSRLSPGTRR